MCDWQKMGPLHLMDEGLLLTTFERSRLYELFCLFKLVDDLGAAGFDVIEHRRHIYSARPPMAAESGAQYVCSRKEIGRQDRKPSHRFL